MAKQQPAANPPPLPGTERLEEDTDFAQEMVAGIDRVLRRELEGAPALRSSKWRHSLSSSEAWEKSAPRHRKRFHRIIGLVDEREEVELSVQAPVAAARGGDTSIAAGPGYRVFRIRWTVFTGIEGEGLLIEPDRPAGANVIALPDCDWTPEMLVGLAPGVPPRAQFARRLAESGCRVLVPFLLDRSDTHSGYPWLALTNQPHREFVYRAAYQLGRHIIGYEVQKVLAAVDWFERQKPSQPVGVIGYGEGGLLALYAAAADPRLAAAAVCGYFGPREDIWQEPIYRNVFGLLTEFGDAELAALVTPRPLLIEACRHPRVDGPPPRSPKRIGGAIGVLRTPPMTQVKAEFERARKLTAGLRPTPALTLVERGKNGLPGSDDTLSEFLRSLGIQRTLGKAGRKPRLRAAGFDFDGRLRRQFEQLVDHTQILLAESRYRRDEFWVRGSKTRKEAAAKKVICRDGYLDEAATSGHRPSRRAWERYSEWYREYYWKEIIGKLPRPTMPLNPRSRLYQKQPRYTAYEVLLDVYPDVFTSGLLLLPKSIRRGERRPVVVCQHGLEGRPQNVADTRVSDPCYNQYACRLAERGFVVYAPQNPYIGEQAFRTLQRMANPLSKTFFAFIIRQHERTLEWLSSQPFVDPERIAFYGLSYGGFSAVRIPAIVQQYCLSICSANFSEWNWKVASTRTLYTYMFGDECEMPEFNMANTFGYAELTRLISPRPFMVERGIQDPVGPDEWVAYEFARTKRHYMLLGLADHAELEIFDGGHEINAAGTFRFLERHLQWKGSKNSD